MPHLTTECVQGRVVIDGPAAEGQMAQGTGETNMWGGAIMGAWHFERKGPAGKEGTCCHRRGCKQLLQVPSQGGHGTS